jgi:hypothetical protein
MLQDGSITARLCATCARVRNANSNPTIRVAVVSQCIPARSSGAAPPSTSGSVVAPYLLVPPPIPRSAVPAGVELQIRCALCGGLIPARAIGAPVAEPHLYRVVVRPLLQHHVRPREGVDQRDNLDLLAGRRVILCVEETETVEHGFDPFRLAAGRRLTVLQPQRDCDGRAAEEHHG